MCRTADFMSLADSSDQDDLPASSHPSYAASRFYFLRLHPALLLISDRNPQPRDTSPPPSTLDQSISGLSLPYTHSRSTRAIQSFLYLFSIYTTCPFPRSLSPLAPFFPDFFCYAHTRVLCTLLCVCSPSQPCGMPSLICHSP